MFSRRASVGIILVIILIFLQDVCPDQQVNCTNTTSNPICQTNPHGKVIKHSLGSNESVTQDHQKQSTGRSKQPESANETSDSRLEPIYLDASLAGMPFPGREFYEQYGRLVGQQVPLNPFYSVDETLLGPQKYLSMLEQAQSNPYPPKKQFTEHPLQLELQKMNVNSFQETAINNFELPVTTFREKAPETRGKLYIQPEFYPKIQQQFYQNHSQSSTTPKLFSARLEGPASMERPRVLVNLSNLLLPGEALLGVDRKQPYLASEQAKPVSSGELQKLLNQLEPLALKESERMKSSEEQDGDEDEEEGEAEEGLGRKFTQASLSTRNTPSGSALNANSKLDKREKALKTLARLSSELRDTPQTGSEQLPLGELDFYRLADHLALTKGSQASQVARSKEEHAIPIEVLVDHLMSNSRVSSFGGQHAPSEQSLSRPFYVDDTEEEDEELEDEDSQQKPTQAVQLEAHESVQSQQVLAPSNMVATFNSIQNTSDSWIPLGNMYQGSRLALKQIANSSSKEEPRKSLLKAKEKKAKKRRKKRSKSEVQSEANVVIGNKKLSRPELMRLMVILNKMASEKEDSGRREASRKLLRFLVKLAVEQYKRKSEPEKSKSDEQFVRSLLSGPNSAVVDDDSKSGTVIELKTLGIFPGQTRKEEDPEEDSEDESGEKEPSESEGAKKRSNLKRMSEKLENYFDSDFFEDMADKAVSSNYSTPNDEKAATATMNKSKRKKPLTLPVPIYRQQLLEAADEEDVDLDQDLIIPRKRLRATGSSARETRRRARRAKRKKLPSESSVRRRRSGKRRLREHEEEPEVDPDENEDDYHEATDGPKQRSKVEGNENDGKLPTESRLSDVRSKSRQMSKDGLNERDSEESVQGHEADRDDGKVDDDEVKEDQSEKRKRFSLSERRRKRKRGRKRGVGGRRKRKPVDLDTRYEIPAPIDRGKLAVAIKSKPVGMKDAKRAEESKPKSTGDKSRTEIESKRKRENLVPKGPRVKKGDSKHSIKNRSTSAGEGWKPVQPEQKSGTKVPPNAPKESDDFDDDYHNEGTTYSEVCNDDGNCKITMESNNPKLRKAIRDGERPEVEKQLDKWASGDDD